MTSERVQRRIERLLDQAEEAADRRDWDQVAESVQMVLGVDPENADALAFQAMLENAGVGGGDAAPASVDDSVGADTSEETPTSFANDRYLVSRFLGEGGKKRVFLAHDTLLGRDVAFGLIKTEGFDQTSKERISREAQAMGRLGVHPNIVAVLDLGQDVDGSPFMVTEFMSGGDVEGLLEGNAVESPSPQPSPAEGRGGKSVGLSLERTIEIGKAVCEGLEFAHSRDIIHRDLKPGNVWLTEDGIAKIGDFGLAMMTDRSRLTREAMMIGTPHYMPPEQATGGDMTPKSDLYSLGAMLYEMVTGRPPFLGDEEIAIISQHINTPPVAPTWHNGTCPRPLEALIMRMLAKDPSERPDSAQDVYNALDAIDLTARGETVERDSSSLESLAGGVFVGRQVEMDQLKGALENVLGGSGRLVTVMGEPGIGKTRTSEEFATYAELRGAQVLWGRCYETGGQPPYWPWVQAIRSYVREIDADELRRQMGSSASVMSEIVTDIKDRLPETQPPPQIEDPDSARFRLFDSIASFLKSASQTQPLVIVLDDLHWSDRPSLQFLEFMTRELGQSRVMLLCTYRDMELNRRHPLTVTLGDLARERLYERVLLRGLTETDVGRFIEIAAGIQPLPELSATVYRHTEGNPLFVTEVVRELVQSGEMAENRVSGDSTWSVRIPEGVREVIGRRLDRLSERANELLTTAAVVGRDFTLDVMKQLAEDTTESQLLDVLDEALDARLIEELTDEVGHYQFTHALMQETLMAELSLTRRVRLHARIADSLEQLYGDASDDHAPELAYHYGEAEAVLGTDRLLHYSIVAGEAALERVGYDDAEEYFSRAMTAATSAGDGDVDELTMASIHLGLGRAIGVRGLNEERQIAWNNLESAFDIYVRLGATDSAVQIAKTPMTLGGLNGATAVFKRALDLVPEGSIDSGWIWTRYGTCLMDNEDDPEGAEVAYRKGEAIALDHQDGPLEARAHAHLCQLANYQDDREAANYHGERAARLAFQYNEFATVMRSSPFWAESLQRDGDLEQARQVLADTLDASRRIGSLGWRGNAANGLVGIACLMGDWGAADEVKDDLVGGNVMSRRVTGYLGMIGQLHTEGLETPPNEFLNTLKDLLHDEPLRGRFASGVVAQLSEALDYEPFRECAAGIAKQALESRWSDSWRIGARLTSAYALGKCLAQDSPRAEIADTYQRISATGWKFSAITVDAAERIPGRLAGWLGNWEASRKHFEQALVDSDTAGARVESAFTRHDYAGMLLDRDEPGDREKAVELQDEALVITRELGMRPLTERILARREILRA